MLGLADFRITLPVRDPAAKRRNFLISVDGRSSNRNIAVDQEHHDVSLGMGSFVFLRITDRDGGDSMWVYETDFILLPGVNIPPEDGFKVKVIS